jgi:hypothetical protein
MFEVSKRKSIATLAIAVAALPTPALARTDPPTQQSQTTAGVTQDLRSADALDSSIRATRPEAGDVRVSQDLRSADALDSAIRATRPESPDVPVADPRDLRSPDARDAAAGRGTFSAPEVTVVRVSEPSHSVSGGLDWGDAGIGAAGAIGLILLGLGGTLVVMHRRHGSRQQPATTP